MPPKKKDEDSKKKDEEPKLSEVNFKSKDPQTLYHLLFSKEENILWRSCDALYNYSLVGEPNKTELLSMGTVKAAIPHLLSADAATRRSSVMLVNSLSQLEESRAEIREEEVVAALINLLKPEEGVMTHEHATKCLLTIADQYTTKSVILENGGVELLVQLITDPDPLVQQNTLETIELLAVDSQCRIALNEANVVTSLLEALNCEYPAIQLLVLKVTYSVCQEECVRTSVKDVNGLEALLKMLTNEEVTDLHEGIVQVVGVCMLDTEQLDAMKDSGCLLTLANYATSTEPQGQLNALRAISTCSGKPENCQILHDNEIETTIMTVLGGEHAGVLAQACLTVSTMVANPLVKETFTKIGVIQALMKLIGHEDQTVQEMSTLSLANLSLNSKVVCLDIIQDEHVTQLVEVLEESTSPRILSYLATVVFNIVKFETLREQLVSLNVMQSLSACLTNPDTDVCIAACKALAALVADSSAREELLKTNALGSLVSILKESSNKEVLRKAAWTIGISVANEEMAKELNKNGALQVLMDMCTNDIQGVSNLAVVALEKLLHYDLAAKYWHMGTLSQTDVVKDGFYDTGAHKPGDDFKPIKLLLDRKVDNKRAVLYVSSIGADPEPADMKSEASTTGSTTNVKTGRGTAKGKKPHKAEEKKEEVPEPEPPKEQKDTGKPRVDSSLREYIEEATSAVGPLPTQAEQIAALSVYVSNQMGGPVTSIAALSYDLHIAQIKADLKTNVIPIGFIKRGIFYHRALLFKVLADRVGVPASLVRGEYNRAWNEVTLVEGGKSKHYLVDLMWEPGQLLEVGSHGAGVYKKL
ncbi:armadillo repeat-containing protein 3-like [Bolinopsis microptera]|uniref:armadillo repeat-containing protein 3-like n=1 Tax=Bolinopsis microptera TaxID=2820187 RepID=UPI00307921A5